MIPTSSRGSGIPPDYFLAGCVKGILPSPVYNTCVQRLRKVDGPDESHSRRSEIVDL